MSISPISQPRTRLDDDQEKPEQSREREHEDKPFDFSGKAYASITLPHALLPTSTPRPTLATVVKDATDLEGKLARLRTDLASPGMREWLGKHVEATKTGVSIGVKVGSIALMLVTFKEKGAAMLLGAEGLFKLFGSAEKISGLVTDCKTFARQLGEEHTAAKAAHPDVVRLEHDLLDVLSAGTKLESDLRRLAGT